MPSPSTARNPSPKPTTRSHRSDAITEELVQKVTERVYAMLLADLALELERRRPSSLSFSDIEKW